LEEVAGFPKSRRLLKRSDFLRVQKGGAGAGSRNYVVIALAHPSDERRPSRLGLVASRKTGNAVARNRGKRVAREWFRLGYQGHEGFDIVIILRSGAPLLGLAEASQELDNGLRRAIKKAGRHR
jgi:ribonuclease P protein component